LTRLLVTSRKNEKKPDSEAIIGEQSIKENKCVM